MPTLITPTTELEAVNECLENIGQAPVSAISGDLGVDTQTALNQVRKVNRALQSMGWYWNTDYIFPLVPNVDGDILLAANTLQIRSVDASYGRNVTPRGQRLYDMDNFTYNFGTETIYANVTLGLSFEELPEAARRYISLKAARIFQDRIEDNVSQSDTIDETDAMRTLHQEHLRVRKSNVLRDNFSTFKTVQRRTAHIRNNY